MAKLREEIRLTGTLFDYWVITGAVNLRFRSDLS